MEYLDADIAILGAGFGGSLTALLAQRIGLRPVLVERGTHPRFTIGESSTPIANLVLEQLAGRYGLNRLRPLCKYGLWKRTYPHVACGLKRGFSYFQHRAGEPFAPDADHGNELLVAANPSDERGDTQWYRADVDHFLVNEVRAAGIACFDHTTIEEIEPGDVWRLTLHRDGNTLRISAPFVVDATGAGGVLRSLFNIADRADELHTRSRTVYSHFKNVHLWREVYEELDGRCDDHPFSCDAAALHHVFDGGWMWVLRFDNGITSAGFVLDCQRFPADDSISPQQEWTALLKRFPSIARQFDQAEPVEPFRRIDRLQRLAGRIAGRNWALLPYAAYFLDPLHSAGIAHTLVGIERLMAALPQPNAVRRAERLAAYERILHDEVRLLDRLIHGCYLSFDRFALLAAYTMLYFCGATISEHLRRQQGLSRESDGFLYSHGPAVQNAVRRAHESVLALSHRSAVGPEEMEHFRQQVTHWVRPFNLFGFCDPAKQNMYDYTEAVASLDG